MTETNDIIFGIHSVFEAVNAGKTIEKVFFVKGKKKDQFKELEIKLKEEEIPFVFVPIEKLNRLTRKNHHGVVAKISPVAFLDFEILVSQGMERATPPIFLLLDQLTDVRNFGSLIRTAECAGVAGIVIQSRGSAPVTSDTVKTSSGALFNIPISKVANLKDAVFYMQASGVKILAATEKASLSIYEVPLNIQMPIAIVMGAEDRGISPLILKQADVKAKLPMLGKTESLNVAVAGGIVLFEVLRQRLAKNILSD